jgi:hypothetical protein
VRGSGINDLVTVRALGLTILPGSHDGAGPRMQDDGVIPFEDLVAIAQVARDLWQTETNGTNEDWSALPLLAKQGWRNRARREIAIWRQREDQP